MIWRILAVLLLVGANGFFVAAPPRLKDLGSSFRAESIGRAVS